MLKLRDGYTRKHSADETFTQIFYRSNSNGAGALQCYEGPPTLEEQIDRYAYFVLILPCLVCEFTTISNSSLLRRYNPDGAGALHGYDKTLAEREQIER